MDEHTRKIIENLNASLEDRNYRIAELEALVLTLKARLYLIECDYGCEDFQHEDFLVH